MIYYGVRTLQLQPDGLNGGIKNDSEVVCTIREHVDYYALWFFPKYMTNIESCRYKIFHVYIIYVD